MTWTKVMGKLVWRVCRTAPHTHCDLDLDHEGEGHTGALLLGVEMTGLTRKGNT